MRALELGKAAVAAERLRLVAMLKRQLRRGAYGGAALVFIAGVIVWASIVAFLAIALAVGPLWAAAILLLINLILCGLLVFLALRSQPGAVEVEAAQVRDAALAGARQALAITALVGPVGRLAGRSAMRMTRAAVTAPFRSSGSSRE